MTAAPAASRERRGAGLWLMVAAALLTVPVVLTGRGGTSEADDEARYHLQIIDTMREQWPAIDIVDYDSATAPGYHAVMAGIAETTGGDVLHLRLVNVAVSLALLAVLFGVAKRWSTRGQAALLLLPVLASTYFLSGAIWLTTDNASLLWVTISLGLVTAGAATPGRLLGAGLAATVAVAIRQVHLWVAGPIALAGALASPLFRLPEWLAPTESPSWWRLVAAVVAVLLPTALLVWFYRLWGGLTPVAYRDLHDAGVNYATYAFTLALIGGSGVFFLPALGWRRLRTIPADRVAWIAAVAAFVLALIWPTSWDYPWRGGGSLWRVVEGLPVVAERSLLLPPLAALGAITLVALCRGANDRGHGRAAIVILVGLLGFVLAQSFNSWCFQRYLEVLVLGMLAWLTAMAVHPPGPMLRQSRWWIGPVVLALGQLAISVMNVYLPVLGNR